MVEEPEVQNEPPRELRPFLDEQGRLKQWPVKLSKQMVGLEWLSQRFAAGREYTEREVNEILNDTHTFGDWAMLRRGLCDHRFLDRDADGSRYWKRAPEAR